MQFKSPKKFALILLVTWIKAVSARLHFNVITRLISLLAALIFNAKIMLDNCAILVLFKERKHADFCALFWVDRLISRICLKTTFLLVVWRNERLNYTFLVLTFIENRLNDKVLDLQLGQAIGFFIDAIQVLNYKTWGKMFFHFLLKFLTDSEV